MGKSKTALILASAYLLIGMVVYVIRPGSVKFLIVFSDTLPVLAGLFTFVSVLIVATRFDSQELRQSPWAFLGLGLFLWWLGEIFWWILEVAFGQKVPYPSIADIFWLAGYVPLFIGFILNYRRLDVRLSRRSILLWSLPLALVMTVSFVFVFLPIAAGEISALEKSLDLLYPTGDVALLGVAFLTLAALGYGVLSRPWKVMALGFILMLVADLIYSYLSFFELYKLGSFIDLVWVGGYLIIGQGAIVYSEMLAKGA